MAGTTPGLRQKIFLRRLVSPIHEKIVKNPVDLRYKDYDAHSNPLIIP